MVIPVLVPAVGARLRHAPLGGSNSSINQPGLLLALSDFVFADTPIAVMIAPVLRTCWQKLSEDTRTRNSKVYSTVG